MSPALLVLGDMSVQGNIKPLRSLVEPLRVAMDNGAKRALIPIENKRTFLDVSAEPMKGAFCTRWTPPVFWASSNSATP